MKNAASPGWPKRTACTHSARRNTALGLAADLQLASTFPNTDLVEYLTGSPFIDELVVQPWQLDRDGMLEIPAAPGLGVTLNADATEKYAGQRIP